MRALRRRSGRSLTTVSLALMLGAGLSGAVAEPSGASSTPTIVAAADVAHHAVLLPHQGSYAFYLKWQGHERSYRVHVPPAAIYGQPLPLVVNMHGATQNAQLEEITSNMDPNADANGYLVVYPNGTRISTVLTPDPVAKQAQYGWNAGECCGLPSTEHLDSVGFLLAVVAAVAKKTPVNLRRVYYTGISNGGMMSYAMAAEASTHVAAIASISGQVEIPVIHPTRSVPTMEFHSINDPIALYDGNKGVKGIQKLSVIQGVEQWIKADHCSRVEHAAPLIVGTGISVGETAQQLTWKGCRNGAQVVLWRLSGSGHVWPGSPLNTGPMKTWILAGVGRGTVLIDANELMWKFFEHYELPAKDVSPHP